MTEPKYKEDDKIKVTNRDGVVFDAIIVNVDAAPLSNPAMNHLYTVQYDTGRTSEVVTEDMISPR